MPTLGAPLDFAKLEGRNIRIHQLSTAPSSPVTGQMYYNTTDNTLYYWNNVAWLAIVTGGPTGGVNPFLQYNNNGAFGATACAAYDNATAVLRIHGSKFNIIDITDGTKITTFDVSNVATGTTRTINLPNANSTTVQPDSGATNNFLTSISGQGLITKTRPLITHLTDLGGTSRLVGSGASAATVAEITLGTGLSMVGNVLTPAGASGTAGGDLSGTYPNPQLGAGVVVLADCNATLIDQVAATASLRTLGLTGNKAMPGVTTLDGIPLATGNINVNGQRITSLQHPPTAANDAATKAYVDATAQGLDVKLSCRLASNANTTISAPGANTDGVAQVAGDRVLLKNQTAPAENGIYVWNGAAVAMTRALDADTAGVGGDITTGMFTFIEEGSSNASSGWVLTTPAPITLGTTGLTFAQFSGAGQITAGAGMTKTGNTLDVGGTANRITVGTDTVDIASNYVGQASITTLGTIGTGVWNGSAVPVANGGTAAVDAPTARGNLQAAGWTTSSTHAAAASWTYPQSGHGLRASQGLIVQCQVAATGAVVWPDITVAANGDVTITFAASQTANSIRTTIIG